MAEFELVMPKLGESIVEATILKWVKKIGDHVDMDDTIVEIATDKVDSEVPSPIEGKITQILFEENTVVAVGETLALIETITDVNLVETTPDIVNRLPVEKHVKIAPQIHSDTMAELGPSTFVRPLPPTFNGRFYSPLVRNIAQKEGVQLAELNEIVGTGLHGRVCKKDILAHLVRKKSMVNYPSHISDVTVDAAIQPAADKVRTASTNVVSGDVEIIQMDRMRKLIAQHMMASKEVAAHVTSFVEADMTNIVNWREKVKLDFHQKFGSKLTFTPFFIEAVVKAIQDYPMINISIDGDQILLKKNINIGMATAMPNGNLIVPVIKNAPDYSLVGLARQVDDLAKRARINELQPSEVRGGTFTITNVGTFGNVMGTPIINQPEVAILAIGAIRKKPAVVETEFGDLIAVRQMVFLSLSYDHRVIDGYLGGSFLRRIADYLEQFDHENATF